MEKKFIPYDVKGSFNDFIIALLNNLAISKNQQEKNANLAAYVLKSMKLQFDHSYNNTLKNFYQFISEIANREGSGDNVVGKYINVTKEDVENIFECIVNENVSSLSAYLENCYKQSQQQEQPQQQQQPIVTEASAANYSVGDIVNKFIPVQSSAPQTIELTDAQKAEFIMHSDVFKNSVKLDSKINAEVSPQQVLNIWEIIHCDAFKNYLHTKGIPINVSYKQVANDHEDPNLNMKFEIIGSNGNILYIGDERRYIII